MKSDREIRREITRMQAKLPETLTQTPKIEWPTGRVDPRRIEVWRSRYFLVQVFDESNGVLRATVNRVERINGQWVDGITWDELQNVKREIGRGHMWAVEIYPKDSSIVNDACMRHLWILPEPLAFGWNL